MTTHETEIWSENDNYMMWVSIDFEYLPPEYEGGHCYIAGEIVTYDVRVLEMEGYGAKGNIVYNRRRSTIDPGWLVSLDAELWYIVDKEIDVWGRLAEELVGAAS
jgi:hypothetical protein